MGDSHENSLMSVRANSIIQNAMRYKSATRLNLKSATMRQEWVNQLIYTTVQ